MLKAVIIALNLLSQISIQQDLSSITDLETLSELPLDKLLKLKDNFDVDDETEENSEPAIERRGDNPEALALQSKFVPYRRGGLDGGGGGGFGHGGGGGGYGHGGGGGYGGSGGGYGHGGGGWMMNMGGKKDISSIFQMSVTTLAFIAFGGYLLCLIVQAIHAKQNNTTTNSDMMAMLIRPSRIKNGQRRKPRPGQNRFKREIEFDDSMYNALVTVAEGYSKYHTVDYANLNSTLNYDTLFD